MALVAGDRLNERYRVLQPLGQGGMATVFLVEEERRGQTRVLKQLRLDQPELLAAFHAEFSLLSRVTHPHLTRVHDFASFRLRGELYHYYTAELVEGVTLTDALRASSVDFIRPLLDALEGLAALHELGMRHGDFTPDNVLVSPNGRGTLIDLGCARPFRQRSSSVAGTPGFLAPELLRDGAGDARADLYSLGATLRFCHERAGLPLTPALAKLTERLLSDEPAGRPDGVEAVLDELGSRAKGGALLRVFSRHLLAREREIAAFTRFAADVRAARPGPRVLCVRGPSGSGVSRLMGELVARAELEQRVIRAHGSEQDPVRWLLATAAGSRELGTSASDVLSVVDLASARDEPVLLVLEDAERLEPAERDLLLALARSLEATATVSLLVSGALELPGVEVETLELGPLGLDALATWTSGSLSRGALERLLLESGGLPALIEIELGRLARARGASAEPTLANSRLARIADDVAELLATERQSLALLLALGGELDAEAWAIPAADFASASRLGLVRRERSVLRIHRRAELEPLGRALGQGPLREAHRQIAQLLRARALPDSSEAVRQAELVRHLCLAGEHEAAARALSAAEPLFRAEPRALCARLEPLLSALTEPDALLLVADLCLLGGELHLALRAVARGLARCQQAGSRATARLLAADALLRLGRAERAERVSRRVLEEAKLPNPVRARAYERLARARLQRQDPAAAEQAARAGLLLAPDTKTAVSLREALGLAAGYLGRTSEAEGYFAEALRELGADASPRDVCRLLGQRAIVAFRAGRAEEAALDHARALAIAERHALDDLVCVSLLNLGTAEQQLGDLGGALRSYERGLAIARPLGRESSELTLRYNLATLRAEISDFAGAERELAALERRASPEARLRFQPVVALVRAELALGRGELDVCQRELERARAGFERRQLERELVEVEIALAELDLARSAWAPALERAERSEAKATQLGASDLAIRASALAARAALACGEAGAFSRLAVARERAAASGLRLLEAKLCGELAAAALASGDPSAAERAERARRLWDRLGAHLPEALRGAFWNDPRRARLERRTRTQALQRDDAEALRRLLSLSRRLNSSLALERVLDYAVQAAVELTTAERGFVLLAESAADVRVAAQHGAATTADPPSRGIVERVLASEEAVLTTDAQTDERFVGRGSVHALRLKSVLCVPISTPAGRLGALYVDSRVQRGRFQEADRELLLALADHLAFALSNARLHAELEQRAAQIEEQRRSLERLSRSKDRELELLRERVQEQQRALGLRYDYSRIVGRSPSMRRVLEQLDRIIDSNASVLVHGESGTGKELVARAIHGNGSRAGGPFVAVNCAALPQALIESELFGHQRGAFTGADRDKKGLMLEANGGTLFLDESRGAAAAHSGQAAASTAGTRAAAGRLDALADARLAPDLRQPQGPGGGSVRRSLPRRSVLSDCGRVTRAATLARARRGHPGARARDTHPTRHGRGARAGGAGAGGAATLDEPRFPRQRPRARKRAHARLRAGAWRADHGVGVGLAASALPASSQRVAVGLRG